MRPALILSRVLLVLVALYSGALVVSVEYGLGAQRHQLESALIIGVVLWAACLLLLQPSMDCRNKVPQFRGVSLVCVCAALVLYWPTLHIGFLSDDYVLAKWSTSGELLPVGYPFARPVVLAVWHGLLAHGASAVVIHLCNVLLHGLNAALLFAIAIKLGLDTRGAVIAGVLFLLWPTQVEAVAWAAGMFDVLATTLLLAAVLITLGVDSGFRLRVAAVVALTVVALFVKENAVVLPFLIAVAAQPSRDDRLRTRVFVALFVLTIGCVGAYMLWRVSMHLPIAGTAALTRYAVKEQLSRTFASLAVPITSARAQSSRWESLLFAAVILALATSSAIAARSAVRAHGVALRAFGWCVVATAPTLGYLFIGGSLEGTRYLYLPAAGWALLIAALLGSVTTRVPLSRILTGMTLFVLGLASVQQRQLLGSWEAAARERDALLGKALAAAQSNGCGRPAFHGLPETIDGAQLFTNGFDEAFAATSPPRSSSKACNLTWNGASFELR